MDDTSQATSTTTQAARTVTTHPVYPTIGRVLAAVGAALFAVAAWAPWWTLVGIVHSSTGRPAVVYSIDPGRDADLPLLSAVGDPSATLVLWSLVSVLGVLLAALLWQRSGSLGLRLASAASVLWAALATAISLAVVIGVASSGLPARLLLAPGEVFSAQDLQGYSLGGGMIAALIGLTLSWVGLLAMIVAELRGSDAGRAPAARASDAQPRWAGSGWLTAGVIVWVVGFLVLPWGTVNCNNIPLFFGVCQGVSGSGALQVGIQSATTSYDPLAAQYAGAFLLAGGGVLLLVGLWLRVAAGAFRAWGWVWALAALVVAVVAYNGIGAIIAGPAVFSLPSGSWGSAAGLWVTFLAIILTIVGLVRLEISARIARPRM